MMRRKCIKDLLLGHTETVLLTQKHHIDKRLTNANSQLRYCIWFNMLGNAHTQVLVPVFG